MFLVKKDCYLNDVFFFFQAEDGIRDLYVTGVQTCAFRSGPVPFNGQRASCVQMEPSRRGEAQACRVVRIGPPQPHRPRSTLRRRQEARMRSYRPYSRAASIIHLTQSGSARGGSSHEVESTKRERFPAVSMQRFTSSSTCA